MFWQPENFDDISAWFEHGPFAFWLVDVLKPQHVTELGTHTGFSYFCLCQAVKRLSLQTKCSAIDTWKGDEHAGFYGDEIFEGVAYRNEKYKSFSTLIRATFDDALKKFAPKSIDLLHIDGRHFYDDVKYDYESWLPKLTDNAVVLLHDTQVRERDFGVWRLFEILKSKHKSFEFTNGYGLGVVIPNKAPKPLECLFNESRHEIQKIFSVLGSAISNQWLLQDTQQQLQFELIRQKMNTFKDNTKQPRVDVHKLKSDNRKLRRTQKELIEQLATQKLALPAMPVNNKTLFQAIVNLRADLHAQRPILYRLFSTARAMLSSSKGKLADLRKSIYFDEPWYLKTYPDVAEVGMDAVEHYFLHGAREGRDPGPYFSTRDYQAKHPETSANGQNPLLHQIKPDWRFLSKVKLATVLDEITVGDRVAIKKHIAAFAQYPFISVVMPVYNTPEKFLRQAVASVQAQLYPHWELCIANDASTDQCVASVLEELAEHDSRVKIVHRATNGNISAATNSAMQLAAGEFIALLDHDDLLHETALYEIAAEINAYPDADVIYSDEDIIDGNGKRSGAYHKTDFNPELLLGQNMVSHLGVYRHSLVKKLKGFREGFEGSQDYDLILRVWAVSSINRIRHIPAILYHWRQGTSTRSFSENRLEQCTQSARKAIHQFLDGRITGAKVLPVKGHESYSRIQYQLPVPEPLVSIIIPTKDRADLLKVCTHGILNKTSYKNLELLIIDHQSSKAETLSLFAELKMDRRVRIISFTGDFNYSAMNNQAAEVAQGTVLALLNNDIEVIDAEWLSEMVSHVVRLDIGAVGAKLYYPDYRIQHAGVVVGLGGVAGHAFHQQPRRTRGYSCQAVLTRAVSAVTGACMVIRKSVFDEVGGFNAKNLPVAFNDVDLCLKVQAHGYRNVWTPFAELIHHESLSRGAENTHEKKARFKKEAEYMRETWRDVIENDPFYNPNLTLIYQNHEKSEISRRKRPWSDFLV